MASAQMRAFDRTLRAVAAKEVSVTLVGESGVGKDVMARRLHELSPRRAGPFVPINCAAIPEALFESEIFGHERGAFTGATDRTAGKVSMANGGTLFLDEIAEMPLGLQAKLLRFLESHRYMRVGGAAKLEADVRLVFATLRPLAFEVKAGRFRPDLYYRIQGIVLEIPPLRERRADIPELLDTFVEQLSAIHDVEPARFTRAARATLVGYAWPGNVRELRNVVEILSILCAGQRVRVEDLPLAVRAIGPAADAVTLTLDRPLRALVDEITDAVIAAEGGNLARAARRLDVSVRTLQRRRA
jgi:DNA-binding NtrC family response regulator